MTPKQIEEFNDFCEKLIAGKIGAPNEFVSYMVEELKTSRKTLQFLESQLEGLRDQANRVRGGIERYEFDINEWVKRHLFPSENPPSPEDEANPES